MTRCGIQSTAPLAAKGMVMILQASSPLSRSPSKAQQPDPPIHPTAPEKIARNSTNLAGNRNPAGLKPTSASRWRWTHGGA
jgi:hypothetical protein